MRVLCNCKFEATQHFVRIGLPSVWTCPKDPPRCNFRVPNDNLDKHLALMNSSATQLGSTSSAQATSGTTLVQQVAGNRTAVSNTSGRTSSASTSGTTKPLARSFSSAVQTDPHYNSDDEYTMAFDDDPRTEYPGTPRESPQTPTPPAKRARVDNPAKLGTPPPTPSPSGPTRLVGTPPRSALQVAEQMMTPQSHHRTNGSRSFTSASGFEEDPENPFLVNTPQKPKSGSNQRLISTIERLRQVSSAVPEWSQGYRDILETLEDTKSDLEKLQRREKATKQSMETKAKLIQRLTEEKEKLVKEKNELQQQITNQGNGKSGPYRR